MPKVFRYYKGTRAGGLKAAETNRKKYGEGFYSNIGAKGGRNGNTGGFAANPALARVAGSKGGKRSTRKGVLNGEGKTHKKKFDTPETPTYKPDKPYIPPKPKKRGLFARLFK